MENPARSVIWKGIRQCRTLVYNMIGRGIQNGKITNLCYDSWLLGGHGVLFLLGWKDLKVSK